MNINRLDKANFKSNIKPKNLGYGLKKVLEKFNAESTPYLQEPGTRVYRTKDGSSKIVIRSFNNILRIDNMPFKNFNKYINTIAGIRKNFINIRHGEDIIKDRSLKILNFAPKGLVNSFDRRPLYGSALEQKADLWCTQNEIFGLCKQGDEARAQIRKQTPFLAENTFRHKFK